MRDLRTHFDIHRYQIPWPEADGFLVGGGVAQAGRYIIPSLVDGQDLVVIATQDPLWDHVSVSRRTRTPNWREMEFIFRLFFREDETAVQFHVPADEHVNIHPYCLHIWRCRYVEIPKPPRSMV